MTASVTVEKLDAHIRFLQNEVSRLGKIDGLWADRNRLHCVDIIEILRQVRQEKQMTGINGKRISE